MSRLVSAAFGNINYAVLGNTPEALYFGSWATFMSQVDGEPQSRRHDTTWINVANVCKQCRGSTKWAARCAECLNIANARERCQPLLDDQFDMT